MSSRVLDTSVVMTIVLNEPGYEVASRHLPGALLSSVNLAEIITKCIEKDYPPQIALDLIQHSGIDIVGFDANLAAISGELFKVSRKGVLSLGDRACIATAIHHHAVVVTADRIWADLDLPCPVELIR